MSSPPPGLIVVGLGPGAVEQLTPEARLLLDGRYPVITRTRRHPVIQHLTTQDWESCDDLYDTASNFEALYAAILARLQERRASATGPIVYAVPGHPLFAEATVQALLAIDRSIRIVPGLSLLDAVAATLGRDPIAEGWQLLDALDLARISDAEPFAGGQLPYLPLRPALVSQLYNRRIASGVKLSLMRLLPDDFSVTLVQAAGVSGQEWVRTIPLYELDRADDQADHLTSLYLPAQEPLAALRVPQALAAITAQLRAPGGCPWDREQTHQSLLPHVVEEAYEVVEAIERQAPDELCEELGDLLLQVALHAQLAEEAGHFRLEDVLETISAKLIRRHPHVFGDRLVDSSAAVVQTWQEIKAAERQAKGLDAAAVASPFAGIPQALPALSRAATIQGRAARVGYQPSPAAALLERLNQASATALALTSSTERHHWLGVALFSLVELASQLQVDPETALRSTIAAWLKEHDPST